MASYEMEYLPAARPHSEGAFAMNSSIERRAPHFYAVESAYNLTLAGLVLVFNVDDECPVFAETVHHYGPNARLKRVSLKAETVASR